MHIAEPLSMVLLTRYQKEEVVLLVWMYDKRYGDSYFVHEEDEKRCWQTVAAHFHEEVDEAKTHVEVFRWISLDRPMGVLMKVQVESEAPIVLYRS